MFCFAYTFAWNQAKMNWFRTSFCIEAAFA
jgi:hypothetical protein